MAEAVTQVAIPPSAAGAGAAPPRTSYRIQLAKDAHKFSAAHFLIFADGTAERLHGHNYRVTVELAAAGLRHGMVVDFGRLKPLLTAVLRQLDERFLVAGRHPEVSVQPADDDHVLVRYRRRRYLAPADEVAILPIDNTSSENLARWIAGELWRASTAALPEVALTGLEVRVEETAGQCASACLERA